MYPTVTSIRRTQNVKDKWFSGLISGRILHHLIDTFCGNAAKPDWFMKRLPFVTSYNTITTEVLLIYVTLSTNIWLNGWLFENNFVRIWVCPKKELSLAISFFPSKSTQSSYLTQLIEMQNIQKAILCSSPVLSYHIKNSCPSSSCMRKFKKYLIKKNSDRIPDRPLPLGL